MHAFVRVSTPKSKRKHLMLSCSIQVEKKLKNEITILREKKNKSKWQIKLVETTSLMRLLDRQIKSNFEIINYFSTFSTKQFMHNMSMINLIRIYFPFFPLIIFSFLGQRKHSFVSSFKNIFLSFSVSTKNIYFLCPMNAQSCAMSHPIWMHFEETNKNGFVSSSDILEFLTKAKTNLLLHIGTEIIGLYF